MAQPDTVRARKQREDGRATRERILQTAAQLATTEGLEGLSIGRLAEATGLSKSGVYAHFRSKEELQLATVETANEIYFREVILPAQQPAGAIDRLREACRAQLSYTERRVFAGGCFFVGSLPEFRTRNGPVHRRLSEILDEWLQFLQELAGDAMADGDLPAETDPAQLAFELTAILEYADLVYVFDDDTGALERARKLIEERIGRA